MLSFNHDLFSDDPDFKFIVNCQLYVHSFYDPEDLDPDDPEDFAMVLEPEYSFRRELQKSYSGDDDWQCFDFETGCYPLYYVRYNITVVKRFVNLSTYF